MCNLNRCRLCVAPLSAVTPHVNVFDMESPEREDVIEKIKSYLSIEIRRNDGLPKLLCHKCLQQIQAFHRFRYCAIRSQFPLKFWKYCFPEVPDEEDDESWGNNESPDPGIPEDNASLNPSSATPSEQVASICREGSSSEEGKKESPNLETKSDASGQLQRENSGTEGASKDCKSPSTHNEINSTPKKVNSDDGLPLSDRLKTLTYSTDTSGSSSSDVECIGKNATQEALKKEIRYCCYVCDGDFISQTYLKEHMRIHTNERLYMCVICKDNFRSKQILKSHMFIHGGDKNYKCNKCNKVFIRKESLTSHQKCHSNVRKFECNICDKRFKRLLTLVAHKRLHTGEKPYVCPLCDKSFADIGSYYTHKRRHSEQRPFKCHDCGKGFKLKVDLNTHMLIHIGVRPFPCQLCSSKFRLKAHLNKHMGCIHSKKPVMKKKLIKKQEEK